ncbi:Two-component response regulator [Parasponia andersonii]|uniref:Two-component response regulator n=1 Tax=Parasponia andersonii TaxID=3476 RepID=A0A2P5DKJ2_PARAD|nr:Two-component response regulator [Parasponia andersonii]
MERMSDFVSKYVPSFAKGLEILLIDHDAISLVIMAAMLEQCSYKVTTTNQASVALSMIREVENHFRLVMANINMPDMDMLSFLRASHQKGVPIILMSSERNAEVADRALAEGACLVLTKPVTLDELKHLWQHACWKNVNLVEESVQLNCQGKGTRGKEFGGIKINETTTLPWSHLEGNMIKQAGRVSRPHSGGIVINLIQPPTEVKETKEADGLSSSATEHNVREHVATDAKDKKRSKRKSCIMIDDQAKQSENTSLEELITTESKTKEGSKAKLPIRERKGKKREERSKLNSELENFGSSMITEKGKKGKRNTDSSKEKSSRVVWDPSLHHKFTTAISVLGDKKAQPKTIQQEMNVPHITTRQVASHLQKYKSEVQKIQDNDTISLMSTSKASNIHAITQFPSPLERQSSLLCQKGHGKIDLRVTSNPWSSSYYINNTKEGNTIQVAKMNLPNLSYAPSKAASPCLPAGMVQFPGLRPQANQNQDLASVFNSKYQNEPSIRVGNATNSKTFETEGSQYIDAVVNQATAVGPADHDETLSEYDDILRILEEDAEDFNYLSRGQTIDDFDKYCEWLEKTLDAKDNDP